MKPELKYSDEEERELIEDIEANADDLKVMAPEEKALLLALFRGADGIPYQTLASMVLQKYVRGTLLEKDAILEAVRILKS